MLDHRDLLLIAKHQISSVVATAVDFATMVALVELGRIDPVLATAFGAFCGATTNFLMGRHWTYQARGARSRGQAAQATRYAIVSVSSLLLNTGGEHLLHNGLGLQYLLSRFIVAIAVSLGWNFPLHRHFVFASKEVIES